MSAELGKRRSQTAANGPKRRLKPATTSASYAHPARIPHRSPFRGKHRRTGRPLSRRFKHILAHGRISVSCKRWSARGRSPSPRPGSAGRGKPADHASNQRTVRIHERASKRLPLPWRERAGVRVKTCGVSSAANSPLSLCPVRNCDAPLTGPIPARQSTSPVSACPMPQSKTSNTTPINC